MALTHMKMSQDDQKDTMGAMPSPAKSQKEQYPYGLRIRLSEAEMKKIGMNEMPKTGAVVMLTAKTKVVSTNESASENMNSKNCELQITHMDVGAEEPDTVKTPAVTLYPNQGK
jgi:hypothetical protein